MGSPKPGFYIVLLLVVAGLVGLAFYRFREGPKKPTTDTTKQEPVGTTKPGDTALPPGGQMPDDKQTEAADANGITTKKEYDFIPSARLPEVKGVSSYKAMK